MTALLRFVPVVLAAYVLALSGCQTLPENWSVGKSWNKLWNPEPKEKKSQYQTPARIVALWAPAMYNSPGKPATRGFGGRLYFYNHKDEPVPIEGQLVVYAYNDSAQRADGGRQADRKFVFTSGQLSSHFSPSELGASYSIWIPWDPVGGPQLEISLLPVFTASSGQVVMAEQSKNLLPGTTTPAANAQQQQGVIQPVIIDHRVAPASYSAPVDFGQPAASTAAGASFYTHATQPAPHEPIRTTSIQLTPSMAERLIQERLQKGTTDPNAAPAGNAPAASNPSSATYPIPAGSLPPNMTQAAPANQPGSLPAFNVPTAGSRSWGPTVARMNAPQGNYQGSPSGLTPGATTPVGQSPTRYAPGSLPAPAKANLPPASGPQPMSPGLAAPGYLPPSSPQSVPYSSAPANWQTGSAGVR